jgi:hypothetical protein
VGNRGDFSNLVPGGKEFIQGKAEEAVLEEARTARANWYQGQGSAAAGPEEAKRSGKPKEPSRIVVGVRLGPGLQLAVGCAMLR